MILLGVTGSIAAYKAVELLRLMIKAGQDVQVVMTEAATHFVGPLTFQSLSGNQVFSSALDPKAYQMAPAPRSGEEARAIDKTIGIQPIVSMAHLALAEKANAVIIAPATADSLSAMSRGSAGDLVSASVLSIPRRTNGKLSIPVFVVPAMHEAMWRHPATQANVKTLKTYGYQFIGPLKGDLGRAGDQGEGRMVEPSDIAAIVLKSLAR